MSAHEPTDAEIAEEQAHFRQVVTTFRQYRAYSLSANTRRRRDFYSLPAPHQRLLKEIGWYEKLGDVDDAILANADFLEDVVADTQIFTGAQDDEDDGEDMAHERAAMHEHSHAHGDHSHHLGHDHAHDHGAHDHGHDHGSHGAHNAQDHGRVVGTEHIHPHPEHRMKVVEGDMDKLRSTLKQFVRDWSEEGKREREECYVPILDALLKHFEHVSVEDRSGLRVLVPGAGLGRLTWEVVNRGFSCQGNEFSYFMLLTSFFVLNRSTQVKQWSIYPYVHSFSNLVDDAALLQPISIPDVLPASRPEDVDFSQVAGDFEEIYGLGASDSQAGKWDAVLTCFFIDTAKNIVSYLEIIKYVLAPGGVWINLGPLLWHFENNTTKDVSIELNLEEVKQLARKMGFTLANERMIQTTYVGHPESMLKHVYNCAFWTATVES